MKSTARSYEWFLAFLSLADSCNHIAVCYALFAISPIGLFPIALFVLLVTHGIYTKLFIAKKLAHNGANKPFYHWLAAYLLTLCLHPLLPLLLWLDAIGGIGDVFGSSSRRNVRLTRLHDEKEVEMDIEKRESSRSRSQSASQSSGEKRGPKRAISANDKLWSSKINSAAESHKGHLAQSLGDVPILVILLTLLATHSVSPWFFGSVALCQASLATKSVFLTYGISRQQRVCVVVIHTMDVVLFAPTVLFAFEGSNWARLWWAMLIVTTLLFCAMLCAAVAFVRLLKRYRFLRYTHGWRLKKWPVVMKEVALLFVPRVVGTCVVALVSCLAVTFLFGALFCFSVFVMIHGFLFERTSHSFWQDLRLDREKTSQVSASVYATEESWLQVYAFLFGDESRTSDDTLLRYRLTILNYHLANSNDTVLRNELSRMRDAVIVERREHLSPRNLSRMSLFRLDSQSGVFFERTAYPFYSRQPYFARLKRYRDNLHCACVIPFVITLYILCPLYFAGRIIHGFYPITVLALRLALSHRLSALETAAAVYIVIQLVLLIVVSLLLLRPKGVLKEQSLLMKVLPATLTVHFTKRVFQRVYWDYELYVWYPKIRSMLEKDLRVEKHAVDTVFSYLPTNYYEHMSCKF